VFPHSSGKSRTDPRRICGIAVAGLVTRDHPTPFASRRHSDRTRANHNRFDGKCLECLERRLPLPRRRGWLRARP
jgi:hypothetical protein